MQVETLSTAEYAELSKDNKLPVFSSLAWLKTYESQATGQAIIHKGHCHGTFITLEYQRLGKKFLINPPLALHCGLWISETGQKQHHVLSETKKKMQAVADFLKKHYKDAYISLAFPPEVVDLQPFLWDGFSSASKFTYRLDLTKPVDELLHHMSTQRRKNIRLAEEKAYELKIDKSLDESMDLIENTLANAGISFDRQVVAYFQKSLSGVFTVSLHNPEVCSCALVAYDAQIAYYIAGGNDRSPEHVNAGAFALWNAILEAKSRGCQTFDFCGSSIPSIETFFRGFGGKLTPYFVVEQRSRTVDWLLTQKRKWLK